MLINYENLNLQPSLKEMVEIFNQYHPNHVSTLDFYRNGVMSPAAGVSRLKNSGLVIDTYKADIDDRNGRTRSGVALYKIVGVK